MARKRLYENRAAQQKAYRRRLSEAPQKRHVTLFGKGATREDKVQAFYSMVPYDLVHDLWKKVAARLHPDKGIYDESGCDVDGYTATERNARAQQFNEAWAEVKRLYNHG